MSASDDNPFAPRAVLALVLFGAAVFVALLWMIGSGMTGGSANNGGAHAGGKGLNGYAALADYLERRGYAVRRSRSEATLDDPGLLVLTPPHGADGAELERIVAARRQAGPTLVILPKWVAAPASLAPGAKEGWVMLAGAQPPAWKGFLDNVTVTIAPMGGRGDPPRWHGGGIDGRLPDAKVVLSGRGDALVPLVVGRQDGRVLAAYVADGGDYPALAGMAVAAPGGGDRTLQPLVLVFEPDLLDNYGLADAAGARLAEQLFRATGGKKTTVTFDLTLNGLGRSANLLTLAFTPPFLAATICLLLAAVAVGWRAFLRFGPPLRAARAIAFGKRALVANAAGLIRRAGRLHLIAAPYAAAARERLARALALPRLADAAATEAAIDRALAAGQPGAEPFSVTAARLRAARRPAEMLKAAKDLHTLERTLTR